LSLPAVPQFGTITLAVVEPDPDLRAHLALQLGGERDVLTYPDPDALADNQLAGRPLVAIFGPGMANLAGLAEVERFNRMRPEAGAILVTTELSTEVLQQAFRSGIRDVLGWPSEAGPLYESIGRVARSLIGLPPPPPPVDGPRQPCRVIAVSSTKGGSGKSVVATNLATILARQATGPVVLVDGDLQFGDVAVMMRLEARHTMAEAVTARDRLDSTLLKTLLVRHEPSGLLVLPAPLEPTFSELVSPTDIACIIEVLRTFCAYVVIDTQAGLNDVVLAIIEKSDDTLIVASTDVPNIKDTKVGLQTLRRLGVDDGRLRLVMNRANSKVQLDMGEVEQTLGMKAEFRIPSGLVVPLSVNRGVPVVIDAPRSDVAHSFEELAGRFLADELAPTPVKKSRGLFGR
jgi:pilus assembly protein CpaE